MRGDRVSSQAAWEIGVPPGQEDRSNDSEIIKNYGFGWIAPERKSSSWPQWNGQGLILFDEFPNGAWFISSARYDEGYPAREHNYHLTAPWERYDRDPYQGVSPVARDFSGGSYSDSAAGIMASFESEQHEDRKSHYLITPMADVDRKRKAIHTEVWHLGFGRRDNPGKTAKAGFLRVWKMIDNVPQGLILDVRDINTIYDEQTRCFIWDGQYANKGFKSLVRTTKTLSRIGPDFDSALAHKPVLGDAWHSYSMDKSKNPDAWIKSVNPFTIDDDVLRAMVSGVVIPPTNNALNLRVASKDANYINLVWDDSPIARGYQLWGDGKAVSHTMDHKQTFTRIGNGQYKTFSVHALVDGKEGNITF